MKNLILFLLFITVSCQKDVGVAGKTGPHPESTALIRDIRQFERFAQTFNPKEIDLSKNDDLNKFDLNFIYQNNKNEQLLKQDITNIILLKQYLFHLKNCRQGYDLLSMRNGQAKFLIDYFMVSNQINFRKTEFLNSGEPYYILEGKVNTNKYVASLIESISINRTTLNPKAN